MLSYGSRLCHRCCLRSSTSLFLLLIVLLVIASEEDCLFCSLFLFLSSIRVKESLILLLVLAGQEGVPLVLVEHFQVLRHYEHIELLFVLPQHLQLVHRHDRLENIVDERVVKRVLRQQFLVRGAHLLIIATFCSVIRPISQIKLYLLPFADGKGRLRLNIVAQTWLLVSPRLRLVVCFRALRSRLSTQVVLLRCFALLASRLQVLLVAFDRWSARSFAQLQHPLLCLYLGIHGYDELRLG